MPQESPTTIDVPRELRIILLFACCDIQWPMSKGQATHFVALILTQSCALASVSMAVSNKQAAVFDDPPCLEQGHVRIEPT